jgi:hypothetical protein
MKLRDCYNDSFGTVAIPLPVPIRHVAMHNHLIWAELDGIECDLIILERKLA